MKISGGTIGLHIAIFIWSIFMGITAVSYLFTGFS